jgi:excinuclease ABC subunit B
VETFERVDILRDLRLGVYDVVVGINLLREGLDLPEVSLVCILDADKEGYLRSERSLVQTIGRAARNLNGTVFMYADTVTQSMHRAIDETNRRRGVQLEYNRLHGITPQTIHKAISESLVTAYEAEYEAVPSIAEDEEEYVSLEELNRRIAELRKQMKRAAADLEFEKAADLRDEIQRLQQQELSLREA